MKRAGFIPILDARYRAGGAEAWAMRIEQLNGI